MTSRYVYNSRAQGSPKLYLKTSLLGEKILWYPEHSKVSGDFSGRPLAATAEVLRCVAPPKIWMNLVTPGWRLLATNAEVVNNTVDSTNMDLWIRKPGNKTF